MTSHKVKKSILFGSLLAVMLLGAGCVGSPPSSSSMQTQPKTTSTTQTQIDEDEGNETEETMAKERAEFEEMKKELTELKQEKEEEEDASVAVYELFTLKKYQAAVAAKEPIFLYFYANWCPTCREQEPRTVNVFKNFKGKVHGFRVNVLDTDTDADEKKLADQFKVYIQHTAVFIDKDGKEIKRVIGTQSNEQLETNLKMIAGS